MDVNFRNNYNLIDVGFNDLMSSLQIGEGVRAKICKNCNCEGADQWDTVIDIVGPYNVGAMIDGTNDWASHIILYKYDPKKEKYV